MKPSERGAAKYPGEWLIVLAEHHPPRVFTCDDILGWRAFRPRIG